MSRIFVWSILHIKTMKKYDWLLWCTIVEATRFELSWKLKINAVWISYNIPKSRIIWTLVSRWLKRWNLSAKNNNLPWSYHKPPWLTCNSNNICLTSRRSRDLLSTGNLSYHLEPRDSIQRYQCFTACLEHQYSSSTGVWVVDIYEKSYLDPTATIDNTRRFFTAVQKFAWHASLATMK